MSHTSHRKPAGSTKRKSSRRVLGMSSSQLRAYFVARETLRNLKATPTPWVPADFQLCDRRHVGRRPQTA